jgi:hypothetical protein
VALSFPLSKAAFMDLLPVQDVQFYLAVQNQNNGLASGEILTAERQPPMWAGSVSLRPMKARHAAQIVGLIAELERPGRGFMAYKKNQIGPADDPLGAALGASAVSVYQSNPAAGTVRLQGLPAGYRLAAGDFLAVAYLASPTRYALHQVLAPVVAAGTGITPAVSVTPYLRTGYTTGTAVGLVKPACKAVLVPGSVDYGTTRNGITAGVSFAWRQSFR